MTATIESFIPQIRKRFETLKDENGEWLFGNRSHLKHVMVRLNSSSDNLESAARRAIEIIVQGIIGTTSAGFICLRLGNAIGYISGYSPDDPPKVTENGICSMGLSILNWFALEGLIGVKKLNIGSFKSMWVIVPKGDFTDLIVKPITASNVPSVDKGPITWEKPVIMYNNHPIELVKNSIDAKITHLYTPDKIPEIYTLVNRMNSMEWKINKHVLSLMFSAADDSPFLPEVIEQEDIDTAKQNITRGEWNMEWYRKFILKEVLNKLETSEEEKEELSHKISKKKQKDDHIKNNKIVSMWSKQVDFNKILDLASLYKDETINFCYFFDSRGRMYPVQSYLTPIGSDQAKALLIYGEKYPVSTQQLAITTANLMGQDKIPYADRIEYVYDNMDLIIRLGIDPWSYMDELVALDLSKKDKWQFLAIANVWAEYSEWVADGNDPDSFLSAVPNARDGSNQGLQILSLLGKDEFAAPMVNVAPTYDTNGNKVVGDAYGYIASFLPAALSKLDSYSDTLSAFTKAITADPKKARKVCKRNVMTKSYAGTKYGFGRQHIEDKDDYEFPEASALTWGDCSMLGGVIYDLVEEHFSKPSELMQWMIDGVDLLPPTHNPVLTWELPDGFTAFADKSQRRIIDFDGYIGRQRVALSITADKHIVNKRKHKQAISPNIVHSLDAFILRQIVKNMPKDAPISTVHDSFSTTTTFIPDLVDVAREAYIKATDRDTFKQMMSKCYKKDVELPPPGTLDPSSLHQTSYFIS